MTTPEWNIDRDKFLIDLKDNYAVYDEDDRELFYVDMPWQKRGREITLHKDETLSEPALLIRKDDKSNIYAVNTPNGEVLAELDKEWDITDKDGELIARVIEVPTATSFVRAIFGLFYFLEVLRRLFTTDFHFVRTDAHGNEETLGVYVRRGRSSDDHLLDLSADQERSLDRRIALAVALVLNNE